MRPKSGWAIDVFGASPTMGYVYSKMEMTGMVIHRIHYNIKHFLGVKRALQFQWVQGWHQNYDPDILTHVLPYTSYEPTRYFWISDFPFCTSISNMQGPVGRITKSAVSLTSAAWLRMVGHVLMGILPWVVI